MRTYAIYIDYDKKIIHRPVDYQLCMGVSKEMDEVHRMLERDKYQVYGLLNRIRVSGSLNFLTNFYERWREDPNINNTYTFE